MFSFSDLLYGKPPGSVFTRRMRIRIQEVKKNKTKDGSKNKQKLKKKCCKTFKF